MKFDFSTQASKSHILNEIAYKSASGKTNIMQALNRMRNDVFGRNGDRNGVNNVGVLISDGQATMNENGIGK